MSFQVIAAVVLSFLAGGLLVWLSAHHGLEYLRKHGKPGCKHDGQFGCVKCFKTIYKPDEVLSSIVITRSPLDASMFRFVLVLTADLAPWIDMTPQAAREFITNARCYMDDITGLQGRCMSIGCDSKKCDTSPFCAHHDREIVGNAKAIIEEANRLL